MSAAEVYENLRHLDPYITVLSPRGAGYYYPGALGIEMGDPIALERAASDSWWPLGLLILGAVVVFGIAVTLLTASYNRHAKWRARNQVATITINHEAGIAQWKALIDEHDATETVLVYATRGHSTAADFLPGLWAHHDDLERRIISVSASLPHDVLEKLKAGEL